MKILLLVSDDVSAYYSAALMKRGHERVKHGRGVSHSENPADWMPAINQYMECDGCLLVSDDPQMRGLADWFGNSGKPVWHHLADIPGRQDKTNYRLLYVLVPVFLMVVGALVIKPPWFREEAKPVAVEVKPLTAVEEKPPNAAVEVTAPLVDKANNVGRAEEPSGKNCEKELRRTGDLFRSLANRIQSGEEAQSVVADMRQQEKRTTAACPD